MYELDFFTEEFSRHHTNSQTKVAHIEPPFFVSSRAFLWLPEGMQILALHGFTGRGSDFAPFAELVGGEWHCPDLPGHGPNPQLDCSPEAAVDFVERERANLTRLNRLQPNLTSDLCPLPSVILGYSMGARAALQHAVTHPEAWDALILISPNPGIEASAERATRRTTDAKLAERIELEGVSAFIDFWQQTPMIRSQQNIRADWRSAMQAARTEHTAEGLADSLRQFGQGNCPNLWRELEKLTMPTLLITGSGDVKYTDIAKRMTEPQTTHGQQRTTHAVINGAGHMPHLEAPESVADVIRKFLI